MVGKNGVLGLKSSDRKRLYRRRLDQDPPSLSYQAADHLVVMVWSALRRKRSKSKAILDAIMTHAKAVFASVEELVRRERLAVEHKGLCGDGDVLEERSEGNHRE